MKQLFSTLQIKTNGEGFTNITLDIKELIKENNFYSGMLIISSLHTSCSLLVNENADPNVLVDLKKYIQSLVPFNSFSSLSSKKDEVFYKHFQEGEDDMPAHIKTALTNTSLSLSFQEGNLILGTWQAIYLWEHRFGINHRKLNIHIIGESKEKNL